MRVTICVCTYKRPRGLERLLEGLAVLIFKKTEAPAIEVVVVDNEVSAVNESICAGFKERCPWPIRYVTEPERGISFARNKALASVSGDTDFIAFIDDDEVPDPLWLDELLHAQARYDADVVAGPVLSRFESSPPFWMTEGGLFEKFRYATGTVLDSASTANVLVRRRAIDESGVLFDRRFALSGGEDGAFFAALSKKKYAIVWADEAVVREWIPKDRARVAWLVQRAYRCGNAETFLRFDLTRSRVQAILKALYLLKWASMLFLAVPRLIISAFRGKSTFVRSGQVAAYAFGRITGVAGIRYQEYAKTGGD